MSAAPTWTTALPDWERRILKRQSLMPCGPLFPEEAAAARAVFDSLRIVDAPGSPTIGEACRPWVGEFASAIFGAYNAETGRRLIREFFLLVSKKNSKSTIAAGIMMTALIRNWRKSAEFLILAPTIEVADNSFKPARDMVAADDELREILFVQEHLRTITHRTTGASLKVVAADNDAVSGKKAVGVLIDEKWLFGKRVNAENMLREATGGLASRPEGFVISLSTMSDDAPAGVFLQDLKDYRDIRDGKHVDNRRLGLIFEFPDKLIKSGAYLDPENFYVTNPNLGASVDVEFLLDELGKAKRAGAKSLCGFAAKHLNVEIGLNLRSDSWAGAEFWMAAAEPQLTLESLLDRSEVVVVGIDGGGLDDLLGLTVLGRCKTTRHWLSWSRAWAHKIVLDRRQDIASKLLDFQKDGHLQIVDSPGEDVAAVADIVTQIEERGLLAKDQAIAVDSVGIGDIVDELTSAARGFALERIVGISQGWKLSGAIKTCERRVAGLELEHDGSPMMAWCVGNAKAELRGNATAITKQLSGSAKIDPLMSLFNAVSLMATNPESVAGASVYTGERGLLVFSL
ncbi:MAG: terminase large subunit [Rhodoplanes sp.]|uniref:terminase large subunit n=1 Tax=Rhodoplanes sp. TaxID=1968906 RepID=UPI00180CBE59|nr:terminase TerL endonuclease subunit [Rhodoplanes sp.]NVO13886.1 terminase large subunit [Rhodoplanes sp.]